MKYALAVAFVVVGCSSRSRLDQPSASAEYRADIANLCDAVAQSGADKIPDDQRIAVIAMWLGPHISTKQGHEFLVSIQPLQGEAKAKKLDAEAARVGLPGCALSAEWRK
jgi:hypothetical protein